MMLPRSQIRRKHLARESGTVRDGHEDLRDRNSNIEHRYNPIQHPYPPQNASEDCEPIARNAVVRPTTVPMNVDPLAR